MQMPILNISIPSIAKRIKLFRDAVAMDPLQRVFEKSKLINQLESKQKKPMMI